MKKSIKVLFLFVSLLVMAYLAGPKPPKLTLDQSLPAINQNLHDLDEYISSKEARYNLRANNEARIEWFGDSLKKTEWAIVYLHGFSASHPEGAPAHRQLAKKLGANLFLSRLSGHGYKEDCLSDFTATGAWNDAKEALAIGKRIGEKVILMGTSTGCSYAINLAANYPQDIGAMINLSPNIRVKDPSAALLNGPWGLEIAKIVLGDYRHIKADSSAYALYWDTLYPVNSLVELQHLLESTLVDTTFAKVTCPTLTLCYYKNEEEQDPVVSVDKMRWMHESLGTENAKKEFIELADVGDHVLANPIKSKDPEAVNRAIHNFIKEKL